MVRCVAALVMVTGCTVSVSFDGTEFTCEKGLCPDGLECVEGRCLTGPPPDLGERRLITIDNSAGAGVLRDFPLPLRIGADIAAAIAPGGADLRFTDTTGAEVSHEIERWDASGESVVWIKLPELQPTAVGAEVIMVYGEPDAVQSADADAVWSDYHAVYHLADALDSSPSGFDGSDSGTTAVDGVVGGARNFDGTGAQYIDLGQDQPFARAQSKMTVSAWTRLDPGTIDAAAFFATSIDNLGMTTNSSRLQLLLNATGEFEGDVRTIDGGPTIGVIGPTLPLGQWLHLAFVVDLEAGTLTLFIDGAQVASDAPGTLDAATADTVSTQTVIGLGEAFTVDAVFGDIDEVRLTNRVLDASWLSTSVRQMAGDLATIGPAEAISE